MALWIVDWRLIAPWSKKNIPRVKRRGESPDLFAPYLEACLVGSTDIHLLQKDTPQGKGHSRKMPPWSALYTDSIGKMVNRSWYQEPGVRQAVNIYYKTDNGDSLAPLTEY